MSYEHRLVEAANGHEFYDKIGRDADAEIAALTERLRAVEAERDEWKRKYATQCAGSMSAHERRIHLEAELSALRAELQRKDAALKELCKDEPLVEPEWIESDNHGDTRSNASDITRWHLAKIARAALQPKEPS